MRYNRRRMITMSGEKKNAGIDFVITWVDGSDSEWLKEKSKYTSGGSQDNSAARYRNLDLLKYWFRAVDMYAPWVRKIHFVTWGHYPEWLNTEHQKIHIVKHSDFIPEKYLPVFSSHPIEWNMHRIKGLSNNFVYFNDDMFITDKVKPSDFFYKGLPRDVAAMNAFTFVWPESKVTDFVLANDMYVMNQHFDKKNSIKKNISKWYNLSLGKYLFTNILLLPWPKFTGMKPMHVAMSLKKDTFKELWDEEYELLDRTCSHRFRDMEDVNPWLIEFWQMAKGEFYPRKAKEVQYFSLSPDVDDNDAIYKAVSESKYKLICINDGYVNENYDSVKGKLCSVMDKKFAQKSQFEI